MSLKAAPLYEDVAQGPENGAAYWIDTADGVRIRIGYWAEKQAKGTVLLFPGRTEYIEKYGIIAKELAERGYSTIVVDWRGQGLSDRALRDRRIGYVNSFADFQKDVAAMTQAAQELNTPQPFYLLAHSMGAAIGLRAVIEGLSVEAVLFSAPMWGIKIAPAQRPLAWSLSWSTRLFGQDHRLTPTTSLLAYPLAETFENNMLTTDRGMYDFMVMQHEKYPELTLAGPSLRWLQEALAETRNLHNLPSPGIPCLTWLGSNERIVDETRIHNRMNRWPGGKLDIIQGKEHEVLMDTHELRTRLMNEAVAFFGEAGSGNTPLASEHA